MYEIWLRWEIVISGMCQVIYFRCHTGEKNPNTEKSAMNFKKQPVTDKSFLGDYPEDCLS